MAGNHEYELPSRWSDSTNHKDNEIKKEVKAMNNIKWEDGAVCFSNGAQIRIKANSFSAMERLTGGGTWRPELRHIDVIIAASDFQLNGIRQGDYIEASELGNEQKYNDAVEVFELLGFKPYLNCDMSKSDFIEQALSCGEGLIVDDEFDLVIDYNGVDDISQKNRKTTYTQLMAIGKLKRAMIERDSKGGAPSVNGGTGGDGYGELADNYKSNHSELPSDSVGKKFDQGKPRFSLIPQEPLKDVMSVLEFGASKYGANNWNQVENPQQRYLDAAMRHIMAWQSGELLDEESGKPHLAHAQCCLLFLQQFDKELK